MTPVLILLTLLSGLVPGSPPAAEGGENPWFEDVAETAGVAHPHTNRSFDNPYAHIMEGYTALGAAVAVADYDGDGWEDVFVTDSAAEGRNRLYRNRGDFTFEEVAEAAGVAAGNDDANASADALWFDREGDGDPDLLVVRFGQSLIYDNQGDGTFRNVTAGSGLATYANAITALAFDYDGDGDLDLVTGNYFAPVNLFDPETPHFFPESFETAANGGGLTLYRNRGDGTFEDVTVAAGLAGHTGWTLDLGHADADWDGDEDLYVAADFGTDRFFVNNGDGTFTDATEEAIGIDTKKGMNADWGDYDGDGLFDVYVTNITDEYMREGNFLWRNEGDRTFTDVAQETGTWDTGWGWAGKFFDADNDGWLDLYVVNGWVSAGEGNYVVDIFELILERKPDLSDARLWPPMGDKSLSGYQHNELLRNLGGSLFRDVAAEHGVDSLRDGRGVAVADFDRDGRQDLFVANADALPHLFRNRAPRAPWIAFELTGAGPNLAAVGAKVRLTAGGRTRVAFVDGGNGFAGQSSPRLHFGLGDVPVATGEVPKIDKVEVLWPSGASQDLSGLATGHTYSIREGTPGATPLRSAAAPSPAGDRIDAAKLETGAAPGAETAPESTPPKSTAAKSRPESIETPEVQP